MEIGKYTIQHSESYKKSLDQANLERAERARPTAAEQPAASNASSGERISLSADARLHSLAHSTATSAPDIRAERVSELKQQVDNGTYTINSRQIAQKMLSEDAELFG